MEDIILADLLELDKKLIVNIHLKPFEQLEAIKIAQKKKLEIESQKVANQKKALANGYDNEFSPLVNAFNGQVIDISPNSKDYINIMDINLNYSEDDNPLSLKSDFLLAFLNRYLQHDFLLLKNQS